jgi:histidinol-phosphatase (PHP family)
MKPITNYHTHLYLCKHATGTVEEFIQKAISLNYQILGFSDHGPLPDYFKKLFYSRRMSNEEYKEVYLKDLKEMKEKYKDQLKILGAVEIEYYDELKDDYPKFLKQLDYLVLGQHYIRVDGKYLGIYGNMTPEMIDIYCTTVEKALATGYFKILAHPEVFNWSYPKWDEHCEKATQRIIEAAQKYNVLLEVNANGARRKSTLTKDNEPTYYYPRLEFWREVAKTDLPVVINDDSHSVEEFCDEATQRTYEFAEALGLNIIIKF